MKKKKKKKFLYRVLKDILKNIQEEKLVLIILI